MTEQFDNYFNSLLMEHSATHKYAELLRTLTTQNIEDAREWISDCSWDNLDPEDIPHLSDIEIIRGVDKHYAGGWKEFLLNNY